MKYVVVAGGSGGHIYPALSIINKIKEEDETNDILYIGTSTKMEKDIVPAHNIKFIGLDVEGLDRKHLLKNFTVLKKYSQAKKRAYKILREFKPDIVIGVGGYITLPVLNMAYKLHIPIVIHEQNSIPGLSNKLLIKKVNKICISLPGSAKFFPKGKTVYTGNPRSEEAIKVDVLNKSAYGFDNNKKLVVFVMGSLGSLTMTSKMKEIIKGFSNKDYQVLIITGKNYYDSYSDVELPSNVKLIPYCDKLINLLKDSDLIVSRAGASTIAEITAIGLPAILVPSPYVTNNHQYKNAMDLVKENAALLLEEKDLTGKNLTAKIDELIKNPNIVKENLKKFEINDSASKIYEAIKGRVDYDK